MHKWRVDREREKRRREEIHLVRMWYIARGIFLLCWIVISKGKGFEGKLVYVYDWPEDVVNRWPTKHSHHRLSIGPGFDANYGTGMIRNASIGLHHTHQFSLFKTFYFRLLESKYRTLDPKKASWFFIPYDLGMDSSTRKSDGGLVQTNCPKLSKALELLHNSEYFRRNNGHDHFILHSINQMMLYYSNMKCLEIYRRCFNCTKFSIDSYGPEVYDVIRNHEFMRNRWVSIPFPSNFHFSQHVNQFPWRQEYSSRNVSITFIGSDGVTAKIQKQLRRRIISECQQRPPRDCLLIQLNSHFSNVNIFEGYGTSSPYMFSRFCLMPGGDFPSRKGVLDALLAGCIPVVFQKISAHLQWPYHWGSSGVADRCLQYVDRSTMMSNTSSTFDHLLTLSRNEHYMADKMKCIDQVAFRFQYNVPTGNGFRLSAFPSESAGSDLMDNDIPDAVDTAIDHLF